MGGLAKQLLRGSKSIRQVWEGKASAILLGLGQTSQEEDLGGKIAAVHELLKDEQGKQSVTIKLDDPAGMHYVIAFLSRYKES